MTPGKSNTPAAYFVTDKTPHAMKHLTGRCYVGTSIRPSLLALLSRPRFKVGITRRTVAARWREIDASAGRGREFPLFAAWGLFPEAVEGFLHALFRRWRKAHRGSGRTEWFSPPRILALPFLVTCAGVLAAWFLVSAALAMLAGAGAVWVLYAFLAGVQGMGWGW